MGVYRGILLKKLWVMGYDRVMGYGLIFPANEVSQHENLWVTAEYGLIQVWVITEATVTSSEKSTQTM